MCAPRLQEFRYPQMRTDCTKQSGEWDRRSLEPRLIPRPVCTMEPPSRVSLNPVFHDQKLAFDWSSVQPKAVGRFQSCKGDPVEQVRFCCDQRMTAITVSAE